MTILNVRTHCEGAIRNLVVKVHGAEPNAQGEVQSYSDPSFVQFSFAGEPGARVRVEIRNAGAIVYREEVQLQAGTANFDSGVRYFAV